LRGRGQDEFPQKEQKKREAADEEQDEAASALSLGADALDAAFGGSGGGCFLCCQEKSFLAILAAVGPASGAVVKALDDACAAAGTADSGPLAERAVGRWSGAVHEGGLNRGRQSEGSDIPRPPGGKQ
jgi:hypothetical protein